MVVGNIDFNYHGPYMYSHNFYVHLFFTLIVSNFDAYHFSNLNWEDDHNLSRQRYHNVIRFLRSLKKRMETNQVTSLGA